MAIPERVLEMYRAYQDGQSLAQVGRAFSVSRQSVYESFASRDLPMRSRKLQEAVEFNGSRYTRKPSGYYAKTTGARTLLHRDMWEYHYGPLPDGYDIHHRDHNKGNNDISNFELLTKAQHTAQHTTGENGYTKGTISKRYPVVVVCPICGSQYLHTRIHKPQTCGRRCGGILNHINRARKGKAS